MAIPTFLKGDSLVRLLQGTALGAVLAMVVGFNWGGWVLGSTSERAAEEQSSAAVVSSLAPICVSNFQTSEDAAANLIALNDLSSYKRSGYIEKGGWAILPGSDESAKGVAKECAKMLGESAQT